MASKGNKKIPALLSNVSFLQRTVRIMLPFYHAIAASPTYARQWSSAVTQTDLDHMIRLLRLVSPRTAGLPLGSNGIGYFVSFPAVKLMQQLTNGTTIAPGTAQFVFNPQIHRYIARAMLPLYKELAVNRDFARAFAKAVLRKEIRTVRRMVCPFVKSKAFKGVELGIEQGGIAFVFKFTRSKYTYRNLLYQESSI